MTHLQVGNGASDSFTTVTCNTYVSSTTSFTLPANSFLVYIKELASNFLYIYFTCSAQSYNVPLEAGGYYMTDLIASYSGFDYGLYLADLSSSTPSLICSVHDGHLNIDAGQELYYRLDYDYNSLRGI